MRANWLSRDRVIVLLALAGVTAMAWIYLLAAASRMATDPGAMSGAAGMAAMPGMTMPAVWGAADFALTFAMWWVMMLGMMLPSAAPMMLTFATIARRQRERGAPFVPVAVFVSGYLLVWGVFSALATLLQWQLDRAALLSPMLQLRGDAIAGAIFIAAGIYQFTPLKTLCLRHCRSPLAFLLGYWRDGASGAVAMGWRHGLWCLGCCWVLMLVLFSVGVMNLVWVGGLAGLVLAEKALPGGAWIGRIAGVLLLAFGIRLLAAGLTA